MASITLVPDVGNVGDKVTLKGTGFTKGKSYDVRLDGNTVASFTASAKGGIPAGSSFIVPETHAVGKKGEMGTKFEISAVTKTGKEPEANATFELQAVVSVEAVTAYLGQSVKAAATGLLPNDTYQLVMLSSAYHAFPAGILETDAKGSGKTVFLVPGYLGPGIYRVDLMHKAEGYPSTQNPPPLPILGYSLDALIAGTPKPSTTSPRPGVILIPFTNTTPTLLMPVVYAIIQTSKKRPLQITSSGVSLQPESTGECLLSFAHLPKGEYIISCFAATTSGHIVSKMFNFPLTI